MVLCFQKSFVNIDVAACTTKIRERRCRPKQLQMIPVHERKMQCDRTRHVLRGARQVQRNKRRKLLKQTEVPNSLFFLFHELCIMNEISPHHEQYKQISAANPGGRIAD